MKKKELKNIAQKIAEAEKIIQNNDSPESIKEAKNLIFSLSNKIESLSDMELIDDMVQDILANMK